jgi:hypothetical protein
LCGFGGVYILICAFNIALLSCNFILGFELSLKSQSFFSPQARGMPTILAQEADGDAQEHHGGKILIHFA